MDYAALNDTIQKKVMAALAIINNPEIAPDIRQLNQEILFREVGAAVYAKVYNMNAFDYEIEHTTGPGIDDRHFGLAKVASASVSAGALGLGLLVRNYLDTMASNAQRDATRNASQSGKRVRIIRKVVSESCEWCDGLAKTYDGRFEDAPADIWMRHRGCDCSIITEGYKTRNGLLDNYVKDKDGNRI
jgi:hypothetical protein